MRDPRNLREMLEETICDTCPAADDCGYNGAPICDLKWKLDQVITAVADDLERIVIEMPRIPMDMSDHYPFSYLEGAEAENKYIVEYLRGLLDI